MLVCICRNIHMFLHTPTHTHIIFIQSWVCMNSYSECLIHVLKSHEKHKRETSNCNSGRFPFLFMHFLICKTNLSVAISTFLSLFALLSAYTRCIHLPLIGGAYEHLLSYFTLQISGSRFLHLVVLNKEFNLLCLIVGFPLTFFQLNILLRFLSPIYSYIPFRILSTTYSSFTLSVHL